jgi:hypothetical protein
MLWVIAFSSPDSLVISTISLAIKIISTYQNFGTVTNPATGTLQKRMPTLTLRGVHPARRGSGQAPTATPHTTGPLYLSQFATDKETLTPQWPKYYVLKKSIFILIF